MVAEALSGMMSQAIEKGLFKGFLYGKNKLEISLLQYADDTIFFGEASMENVRAIKAMLRAFELVSDLKINLSKSGFGAFGVSDGWKNVAAEYLNCSLLTLPFTYFGVPIGANPRSSQTWDPIISKCERKVPKKVVNKLGRLQRRFLWGGDHEQSKIAWVKWETVCLPKEAGGLGVKDINSFNLSLLGKWR
ncbi:uncharacterized protein LOC114424032 [Glycine soja]|uniref:uncharacterized protein LOC114424032 n=1 Tax=Glycine soja TaxID=3848 RepID=UPI001039DD67|nr:uncharacterized protein LOC114424032 [Glycine soja]